LIDLRQYGFTNDVPVTNDSMPGRVTEQQREKYTVITSNGEVIASLKGSFHHSAHAREDYPAVGDFVLLQYNPTGESRIIKILPRKTKFSRADMSGHAAGYVKTIREQVVAANFDYVFILSSLNADFKVNRILRYITQTRQSGGQPVVILTKSDLIEDYIAHETEVTRAAYDVPVHSISSHTGQGLRELGVYLQPGKTIVFLGMSGVGKSSLLNALMSTEVMAVKSIREDDSRGRHTTTHRQLFMLSCGAMIIDTPGMRELGIFDAEEGISEGFADVEDLFAKCRFSDCKHKTEPGCAVRAAIASGVLPQERWERYQAQVRENRFVDDRAAFMRDRRDLAKSLTRLTRTKKIKPARKGR